MSSLTLRLVKGSALTYAEADDNFSNLNTDKLQNIVEDTTPQLGGSLDVNGNAIVSTSNANIELAPNGTGDVLLTADTIRLGDSNANATVTTNGTGDLVLNTNAGTNSGSITIADGVNGDITLAPNGTGKIIVNGTLQVDGTTTTVNSTVVTVDDPIFTLGGDTAPASDDNKDRGIEFRYHTGAAAKVGFFGYDDSTGYLTFIPDATNTSEVFSGTKGDIDAANFRGALVGNASTATTAAALTTTRAIYGNNFDGSAALTQVIASTFGGTGNGFAKISGPTTTEKTFTLPDASSTIVVQGGDLGTPSAGTLTNCTFPTLNQNTTGSAATLTTGRTIALTGDVTYTSGSFDGSGNVTGTATLANTAVTPAAYTSANITIDSKGRITAAANGSAGMTSFTAAGDTGTSQSIENGNTFTISGGTGLSSVASATDTITVNLDNTAVAAGSYTAANITVDAQGRITAAANGSAGLANIVEDTTPQLGGSLDVNGQSIVSVSNGNIELAPNGTGDVYLTADTVRVGDSNANATITTNGTGDLVLNTNAGSSSGSITIADGVDANISISPNGTGQTVFGDGIVDAKITSNGAKNINITTNSGTNSGTILINHSANGNIGIAPNGTGKVKLYGIYDMPSADGTNGQFMQTNGSGTLTFATGLTSGGALGTPSSGTVTNLTGTASININGTVGATTATTGAFTTLTATGTTTLATSLTGLLKAASGVVSQATAGTDFLVPSGALGTPSSGTLTNCTGLPIGQLVGDATASITTGTIELGNITDTTLARSAAGVVTIEGVEIVTLSRTQTLTNKTLTTPIISSISNSGTLTLPTSTDTLVGRATTDTLTNKTLTSPTMTAPVLGTPASGTLSGCTVDGTNKVGYLNIPNSGAKTASYTLVVGDVGKFIELGTGGTVVVPASIFAAGDAISIFNNTSATISCTCSAVTTVYKGGTDTDIASFSVTTRGVATILFITTTVAVVTGNLA